MILPFFHPTTVVFVDDSTDFLLNLSLQLDSTLAFRLFASPTQALEWVNSQGQSQASNADNLFSPYRYCFEERIRAHKIIDVNFDVTESLMFDANRFNQVAVVVVDFDMPAMDGIEFCRQIKDGNVKKILLTGKADETVAVKAFNNGDIDRFIVKQGNNVITELNDEISQLQHQYFESMERNLLSTLTVKSHQFLQDDVFENVFLDICIQLGIVEYYVILEPQGVLMIDQNGLTYLLLVMDEESLTAQLEIAEVQAAPAEMMEVLKSGKHIPYFGKDKMYYAPQFEQAWRDYFHPADAVIGNKQHYQYAVIKQPLDFDTAPILAYRDFLIKLDQLGFNAFD
jgi:CheY-like chemotaxis protein